MMEYAQIIRILLRRWWLILLPLLLSAVVAIPQLIGGAADASSGFALQLRYSAAQKPNLPELNGDLTDVWTASEHTVDALTDWARTSSFRAEIARQIDDADLSLESLSIAADNVRNIGVIYLNHSDRDSLAAIGDAVILVLAERNQAYFPQLGGEAAQVTILGTTAITATAAPLTNRLAPILQLGIALLIGLALAFFAEIVDPTIYHQDDLRRLGLPLRGSIPAERA